MAFEAVLREFLGLFMVFKGISKGFSIVFDCFWPVEVGDDPVGGRCEGAWVSFAIRSMWRRRGQLRRRWRPEIAAERRLSASFGT